MSAINTLRRKIDFNADQLEELYKRKKRNQITDDDFEKNDEKLNRKRQELKDELLIELERQSESNKEMYVC